MERNEPRALCLVYLSSQVAAWASSRLVCKQATFQKPPKCCLSLFTFIYGPSKARIMLTLCDLMELSRENWVSYSGLAAINTDVAVKRGLRQHFSAYQGAGESVH